MLTAVARASCIIFQRSLLVPVPCPYFICHSRAWNIPVLQLSSWASPDTLSKGHQIQSSLTHSLLAWRSAKLKLSGSTHCSTRPLRCLSKQRLEQNRCLGSTFRSTHRFLPGTCCSPLLFSGWMLLEVVCSVILSAVAESSVSVNFAM